MERAALAEILRPWAGPTQAARNGKSWLISEAEPEKFMTAFAAAVTGDGDIFLCDPAWGAAERAQLDALVDSIPQVSGFRAAAPAARLVPGGQQAATGRSQVSELRSQVSAPSGALGWLMIPTGGTGGQLKFARHDATTIGAAVKGFGAHFGMKRVNAIGVLPLHHVSGLMAWLRCALTGGEYRPWDWKRIEGGEFPALPAVGDGWVISLVPTQLERLLREEKAGSAIPRYGQAVEWLRQFRIIFLGGAAAAPGLLDRAAAAGLRLSPGYGMTETAAMVATLRPEEFLAGVRSNGAVLPHARVSVAGEGRLSIGGGSLFRGYFPQWREAGDYLTADLGWLDERGQVHVQGRGDGVIVTGGEKVNPAEVEAALRDTGEFTDVVVVGVADAEWGQVVVAAHPAADRLNRERIEAALAGKLVSWKRPKRYVALAQWPLTSAGKVNRQRVAALLEGGRSDL